MEREKAKDPELGDSAPLVSGEEEEHQQQEIFELPQREFDVDVSTDPSFAPEYKSKKVCMPFLRQHIMRKVHKNVWIIAMASTLCSILCFLVVAITSTVILSSDVNPISIDDVKKAGYAVKGATRESMNIIGMTGEAFVQQIRQEYKRRDESWKELAKYNGNVPVGHSGPLGNLPPSTVSDDDAYDPIDWRYGPHHTLEHFDPKNVLPPVCPMLQNHLRIDFDMDTNSFDVYGYPCVMEMHWSKLMNLEEIEQDENAFISKESNSGRVNNAPFHSIKCTRRYRMNGFTPWECVPSKRLPTRYMMVYNVGCVDIDAHGDVNVKSVEAPYHNGEGKDGWIDLNKDGGSMLSINPAYDKQYNKLEQGHYCHINYAITNNPSWARAYSNSYIGVGILVAAVTLSMCLCSTSPINITICYTLLVAHIVLVLAFELCFRTSHYISQDLASFMGMFSIVGGCVGGGFVLCVGLFEMVTRGRIDCFSGRICTQNTPIVMVLIQKILRIIVYGRSSNFYDRGSDNLFGESDEYSEEVGARIYVQRHISGCTGNNPDNCDACYTLSRQEESYVLRPGDKGYQGTIPDESPIGKAWKNTGHGELHAGEKDEKAQLYEDNLKEK